MKILFLMILLTRNGAGDLNAAFVSTGDIGECQLRMLAVRGIFHSAGVEVVEGRCVASGLRFSEFEHARSSRQARHFYLLRFEPGLEVLEQPEWRSCHLNARNDDSPGLRYCASSVQRLLR
ncbi:MAG: hypothetical protein KDI68_07370 [Gammaproteobacteria bacterium]|nr:hypothetical protein [Gammaproteobacteria bacterium]